MPWKSHQTTHSSKHPNTVDLFFHGRHSGSGANKLRTRCVATLVLQCTAHGAVSNCMAKCY